MNVVSYCISAFTSANCDLCPVSDSPSRNWGGSLELEHIRYLQVSGSVADIPGTSKGSQVEWLERGTV